MLSNVQRPDKAPGAADPNVLYWLDSADKLKAHVGHQVQVVGMLDDDVDQTKVKTKDGKVEVTSERTKKVEVKEGSAAGAAVRADDTKRTSYKVKVQSVTMVSGSCAK